MVRYKYEKIVRVSFGKIHELDYRSPIKLDSKYVVLLSKVLCSCKIATMVKSLAC